MLLTEPKTKNELIEMLRKQQIKKVEVFEDQKSLDTRMKKKLEDKMSVVVITYR